MGFYGDVAIVARPIDRWLCRTCSSTTAAKQDQWLVQSCTPRIAYHCRYLPIAAEPCDVLASQLASPPVDISRCLSRMLLGVRIQRRIFGKQSAVFNGNCLNLSVFSSQWQRPLLADSVEKLLLQFLPAKVGD